MKNTLLGTLIVLGLISIGCTRHAGNSSISIQLPTSASSEIVKSNAKVMTTFTAGVNGSDGPPWDRNIVPESLEQINCYGVAIGGPDEFFKQNSCTLSNNTSVKFGLILAAVPQGNKIHIDVPSGPARKIVLLGFKANSLDQCKDIMSHDELAISAPYILRVKDVDLSPGRVDLPLIITEAMYDFTANPPPHIEDCEGPQVGDGHGPEENLPEPVLTFGSGVDGDLTVTANMNWSSATHDNINAVTRYISASDKIDNMDDSRRTLTMYTAFDNMSYMAGDEVMWIVNAANSPVPDNACGGGLTRGSYGFAMVEDVDIDNQKVTLDRPMGDPNAAFDLIHRSRMQESDHYEGTNYCKVQLIRVPNFENIHVSTDHVITVKPYNYQSGGVLVYRVRDSVNINHAGWLKFDVSNIGYPGALSLSESGGGSMGISFTAESNFSNGGGTSLSFAGAGGGNATSGGDGGTTSVLAEGGDGLNLCSGPCDPVDRIFFGGGGGMGSNSFAAGSGGGAIISFIHSAKGIGASSSIKFYSNGEVGDGDNTSPSDNGSGGGAGGTIMSLIKNADMSSGSIYYNANGGYGGDGGSSSGETGGGGAGGVVRYNYCDNVSSTSIPVPSIFGGAPGAGVNFGTSGMAGLESLDNGDFSGHLLCN